MGHHFDKVLVLPVEGAGTALPGVAGCPLASNGVSHLTFFGCLFGLCTLLKQYPKLLSLASDSDWP